MLDVRTGPTADKTLHASDITVGISRGLDTAASRVIDVGLVDVDQVPMRGSEITALVLQGTLTEHDTNRVLTELLVVGQCILNLPLHAVGLLRRSLRMVGIVITREVVLGNCCSLGTPETLLGAPSEVVLQVVPQLEVDGELRHELMAPAAAGITLHHGDGVVLFLI